MKWFTNRCDLVLAPTPGMQARIRGNGTEVPMAVMPTGTRMETFCIKEDEDRGNPQNLCRRIKSRAFILFSMPAGRREKYQILLKGIQAEQKL